MIQLFTFYLNDTVCSEGTEKQEIKIMGDKITRSKIIHNLSIEELEKNNHISSHV